MGATKEDLTAMFGEALRDDINNGDFVLIDARSRNGRKLPRVPQSVLNIRAEDIRGRLFRTKCTNSLIKPPAPAGATLWLWLISQRPDHMLRVIVNGSKQGLGWASWFSAALFPVVQGGQLNVDHGCHHCSTIRLAGSLVCVPIKV
ncbi:hypothetical protein [Alloalcanivorax dieselolei]|uniref:hypothetical protein n=1 Tax=Alloalcanivorax dieselolei TaxID=285091 RepID=UPI00192BE6FA|nr:hypothetical protein [Alloalcanivorax dieselolei]